MMGSEMGALRPSEVVINVLFCTEEDRANARLVVVEERRCDADFGGPGRVTSLILMPASRQGRPDTNCCLPNEAIEEYDRQVTEKTILKEVLQQSHSTSLVIMKACLCLKC
jgi:hypothetical protein